MKVTGNKNNTRNNNNSRFSQRQLKENRIFERVLRLTEGDDIEDLEDTYGEEYEPGYDPYPYDFNGGMDDRPEGYEIHKNTLLSDEELAARGYKPLGRRTSFYYDGGGVAPWGADLFKSENGRTLSRQELTPYKRDGKNYNYDSEIALENQMLGDTGTGAAPGNVDIARNWEDGNSPGSYYDDGVHRREVNDATDPFDRFNADDPTFETVDYDPFEGEE